MPPEGEREGMRPLPVQTCRDCGAEVAQWYLAGSLRQPVCPGCYLYLKVEYDALDMGLEHRRKLWRVLAESLTNAETA